MMRVSFEAARISGSRRRSAHRRRDLVVLAALEAEGAGHAAAAGVEDLDLEARSGEQGLVVGHPEERPLVAVRLRKGAAGRGGR